LAQIQLRRPAVGRPLPRAAEVLVKMAAAHLQGRPHCRARRTWLLLAVTACLLAAHALPRALSFVGSSAASDGDSGAEETVERAKQLLVESDSVFFDVDSTVVTTEGIDLLGKCFGVMKEISELTKNAMNGNVKFQDAMAQRLELMADRGMNQERLEECVKTEGKPQWSAGVQEVVKRLHAMGKDVYLVSGGFRNMIRPIAETLDIPQEMVYANTILFDKKGNYAGFDRKAPTSRSGGKPAVLRRLKRKKGYKTMIMIGDGATDLDARTQGPAAAFIGYGGVSVRKKVQEGADWFVYGFKELLAVLPEV